MNPLRDFRTVVLIAVLLTLPGCDRQPAPAPVVDTAPPVAAENPLIAVYNARVPVDGVLTGGQPSEEEIERVARAGYRTVVNLRTEGERGTWDEEPVVTDLGMRYISIPVAGVDDINVENARKLAEAVSDPDLRPLFVHCGSGNRIGALFAMKAFHLDGEDAETALAIGRSAGLTRLEPVVAERLQASPPAPQGAQTP